LSQRKKKRRREEAKSFLLVVVKESFVSGVSGSKLFLLTVKFELLSPEVALAKKLKDFLR
jgi:hypothetical protein